MNKISNVFARNVRNFHFVSIILIVLVLFIGGQFVNQYLNQVISVVFYSPFATVKNRYLDLIAVSDDNARLAQSLIDLSMKISFYEEAALENDRLRSILGFQPPQNYTLLPAKVISISGKITPITATINKGANDSIWVDQPVINQEGLIGRISSVSADFAIVQLLTDPSNRVASRVVSSREMGIIKYNTSSGMSLDNFPTQGTIAVGDTIISSGLGGVYPAGLKVGVVTEVIKEELQPFYTVKILPSANFYSLEELFILRNTEEE